MSFETISAKEIEKYIGKNNVQIIDLREPNEYSAGRIPYAINIPYEDFDYMKDQIFHDREIILYCQRGNISLYLSRDLSKESYHVKSIYGGINAYRGPIEK
jgi:rhodanese-related sulfurtransferase